VNALNGFFGENNWDYYIKMLFKEMSSYSNMQFYNNQYKKPLINGLEFVDQSDFNLAYLHSSEGQESSGAFSFKSNDG
jgi:hypothetical protein